MEKKTVLVTGASSGIGASTAILLSKEYRTILCGRDEYRLNEVLGKCSGEDNLIWPCDLSEVQDIDTNFKNFLTEKEVYVNGLVHSAGYHKLLPIKMVSIAEFEKILRVNIISAAALMKVLLNKKLNQGHLESVVLISSNISNFGAVAHSLYSASKAGLDGFMRSAAVELAPKVRVNSVLPGGLKTRMTESIYADEEVVKRMESAYPLGAGETLDIANAVKFLLGPESKWITGQQLTVDGGRTINLSV